MTLFAPGLFWLTRDFRFADNPALQAALAQGPLLAVFFLDAQLKAQGAASRWRLERALKAFDAELRRRSGRGVLILEGEPDRLLPELAAATGFREVHQSDWPTPAMQALQARVRKALAPIGAPLTLHAGGFLLPLGRLRTGQGGAYRVYTPFARALRELGPDSPCGEAPERIASAPAPLRGLDLVGLDLAPDLHGGRAVLERFALAAGEAAALARLEDFLDRAARYAADRDRPDLDAASGLSEHLALGEISPRRLWAMAERRRAEDPAASEGIAKFLSETIWRDFAWNLLLEFPQMAQACWREEWSAFPWRGAEENEDLGLWLQGATGVPLVDAGLREMRVTGRMSNRVRMIAASWLTKHALTDWRLGLRHFAESLTDWDPASNAMNWQWVAGCGPDAAPYFRIFNPAKQAMQYDPEGGYRRRWLAGWMGSDSPEAAAYFETLPSSWRLPRLWRGPAEGRPLEAGRLRALDAYAAFKAGAKPEEPRQGLLF